MNQTDALFFIGFLLFSLSVFILQAISKMQIAFKDKAQADEKAEHTWEYVSILKRLATP
jgi:hypothetical protein